MSLFRLVPTGLDLNGPDLSFTTHPVGLGTSTAGIATFTGIATATFATVGDVANSANSKELFSDLLRFSFDLLEFA